MNPRRIDCVLVGTTHSGNVGAAARALKTMGLGRLTLVAPGCAVDEQAYAMASGGEDVLAAAGQRNDLDSALAEAGLVLGFSARPRRLAAPALSLREAAALAAAESERQEVALVFGRERTGLTNEELDRCHRLVHIPAAEGYGSLNLAAAVQLAAYELHLCADGVRPPPGRGERAATGAELAELFDHLERTLAGLGTLRRHNPTLTLRRLRRLLHRARPTAREVRLLRGILGAVEGVVRRAAGRDG